MRRSTKRIKSEISKLEEQLKKVELREAQRLGALAVKAGLHEVDATEMAILDALNQVRARFRSSIDHSS